MSEQHSSTHTPLHGAERLPAGPLGVVRSAHRHRDLRIRPHPVIDDRPPAREQRARRRGRRGAWVRRRYTLPATAGILAAVLTVVRKIFANGLLPTVTALVGVFAVTAVVCRAFGSASSSIWTRPLCRPHPRHTGCSRPRSGRSRPARTAQHRPAGDRPGIGAASAFSVIAWLNNRRH